MSSILPIGPAIRIAGPYVASAGQTTFTYAFALLDAGDLAVETAPADDPDNWSLATLDLDYGLTPAPPHEAGGSVVFLAPRPAGSRVRIVGAAVIANVMDPVPAAAIDSSKLNRMFDRVTIWAQENRRDLDTALDVLRNLGNDGSEIAPLLLFSTGEDGNRVWGPAPWKVDTSRQVSTLHSLRGGGSLDEDRELSLVGDTALPGADKFYGTDGSGARGWYTLPAFVSFATRTALKANATTGPGHMAMLTEGKRSGLFVWREGNYSTHVSTDTAEGIYLKADAVSSSVGVWERDDNEWFFGLNPLHFGAVADWNGTTGTDNATAFNAIYALKVLIPRLRINIPAGAFRIGSALNWSFAANQHFMMAGAGMDVSQVVFTSSSGLSISYDGSVRQNGATISLRDFAICTTETYIAERVALYIVNSPYAEGMTQPGPSVENVFIRGWLQTHGWLKGSVFENCITTIQRRVIFLGAAGDYNSTAFTIKGSSPQTDHLLDACRATWFATAVAMEGRAEGVVIDCCLFAAGNNGVVDTGEADRPLHVEVTNTHMAIASYGVVSFTGGAQLICTDNLIYEWTNNVGIWSAFSIVGYNDVLITNNMINTWPTTPRTKYGIVLDGCSNGRVKDNIIRAAGNAINIGISVNNCTDVTVDDNSYNNCSVRNSESGNTASYLTSLKKVSSGTASFSSNGVVIVNVAHGLGAVPSRVWVRGVRRPTGSADAIPGQIGAADSNIQQVAVLITNFVSAGTVSVELYCELT